jgi:hypothetical protein
VQATHNQAPEPRPDRPRFPNGYGVPKSPAGLLPWSHADARLTEARTYWVGTILPDGSPHAVPLWGVWFDRHLYFGTDPETRTARNLLQNPEVVAHLESGDDVVILKGAAAQVTDLEVLKRVAKLGAAKYGGMVSEDEEGSAHPAFALKPRVVYAWTNLAKDATRWRLATD